MQPYGNAADISVMGLGYVGLTLSVAFLTVGERIHGVEAQEPRRKQLLKGEVDLYEPSVKEVVAEKVGSLFAVTATLPDRPQVVFICVGTPYDKALDRPSLEHLEAAVQSIAEVMDEQTLVIVRSTVPIGTTREVVLPILTAKVKRPRLVFAPERTIQGKAVEELKRLPQIIGTENEEDFKFAAAVFAKLSIHSIRVSSFEAAEMIKLTCNSHTDVIYSFGNEVAAIAESYGLDAMEIVGAANLITLDPT